MIKGCAGKDWRYYEMEAFYFTFGRGHELKDYVQPIEADSSERAREIMFAIHGEDWSSEYSVEQFTEFNSRYPKTSLVTIYQGGLFK